MRKKLYLIDGGLGKHVVFSSIIGELVKKHGDRIAIMSAYPELFEYHPGVSMSLKYHEPEIYDTFISKGHVDIIYQDPYKSNFVFSKDHLVNEWAKLYDVELDTISPDIWTNYDEIEHIDNLCEGKRNFIVVQFSGGQNVATRDGKYVNTSALIRNYPRNLAERFVKLVKENYDIDVLNYCFDNEPTSNLNGAVNISCSPGKLLAFIKNSLGYVSIDSALQHIAANRYISNKKTGIVLWGMTSPLNYGYSKNINIRKYQSKRPNHIIFEDVNKIGRTPQEIMCMNIKPEELMTYVDLMIRKNRVET